jgi:putative ATP-dependent endonuclease of OLD family
MNIKKVNIENFKCFRKFILELNDGINILVGDNEAGKSTILEAIHLALTGILSGKYLKNELSQYLFNNEAVEEYLKSFDPGSTPLAPPSIIIELYLEGKDLAILEGDGNSEKRKVSGVCLSIAFDEKHQPEYDRLVSKGKVSSLPIEYYDIICTSFARENITPRSIPLKSALIDSSSNRYQNGSDVYVSRIVKELLDSQEIVDISQAHRRMRDIFMDDDSIKNINKKINKVANISHKEVELSVELFSKNAWENSLMTYLDKVPFHHIGKGEQCIIKTKLALGHKKSQEASLILLEEPENHLSHTKLNQLIKDVEDNCEGKQIIISTHSSFVANKLGLDKLILLNDKKTARLKDLDSSTQTFFGKLPGYDTLRLLLCKKAILVEGDSDELIVQKAYMKNNSGRLPIEDGIDVISVGLTFLRFLEISTKINKPTVVVTDNDGDIEVLEAKYKEYLGANKKDWINIQYDAIVDSRSSINGKEFNYNTLEPNLLKANDRAKLNTIFKTAHATDEELLIYMRNSKTDCALKIFDTPEDISFPQYILDAIK